MLRLSILVICLAVFGQSTKWGRADYEHIFSCPLVEKMTEFLDKTKIYGSIMFNQRTANEQVSLGLFTTEPSQGRELDLVGMTQEKIDEFANKLTEKGLFGTRVNHSTQASREISEKYRISVHMMGDYKIDYKELYEGSTTSKFTSSKFELHNHHENGNLQKQVVITYHLGQPRVDFSENVDEDEINKAKFHVRGVFRIKMTPELRIQIMEHIMNKEDGDCIWKVVTDFEMGKKTVAEKKIGLEVEDHKFVFVCIKK